MAVVLAPVGDVRPQFFTDAGAVLNGGLIYFYQAGTTTLQDTFTDYTGGTRNENPVQLDSDGRAPNGIWFTQGQFYKIIAKDADGNIFWTEDWVPGMNDVSATQDQWVSSGLTPTYISATSFSLAGDQTTELHVGRRVKISDAGGTKYGTISTSAYTTVTTITIVGDALASPVSDVAYGLLTATNHSIPGLRAKGDIPIALSSTGMGRLGIGTDGYNLHAESGAANGLVYLPPNAGSNIINGYLDWSVSSSALTVAIKGWDGNDPSAENPVYVVIRSSTVTTGLPIIRKLTASTTAVVSSGSTLGTRNSIPFRVWVVGFAAGGTVRLSVIVCTLTVAGTGAGSNVSGIYPLKAWSIASAVAEGGAGAADSALTFYASNTVTSLAYSVLGWASWESGLATAGTWSAGPTRVQLWGAGAPALPGDYVGNRQRTLNGIDATGTTVLPYDNTIPQNTEGDQYMTQAITPTSAANVLEVTARGNFSNSAAQNLGMALFQDATANALAVSETDVIAANNSVMLDVDCLILAATTSATTFKIRAGGPAPGTTEFNGTGATQRYGGVMNSYMEAREVMG